MTVSDPPPHPDARLVFDLASLQATAVLGEQLGQRLFAGAVVGLIGSLGAGKTHLVRAIARGLDVRDERLVSSPTFVLVQEYPGRLPIYHFDTYRLADENAFVDLGVEEYFSGDGVCLVEWADRAIRVLPPQHLRVTLTITGETSRRATLEAFGAAYRDVLAVLQGREEERGEAVEGA